MHLAIDSGNTRTKFALFINGKIKEKHAVFNNEASQFLLVYLKKNKEIDKAILSCVSSLERVFISTLKSNKVDHLVLTSETKLPIQNHYQTPKTLGKDRIAMAVGASNFYPNQNMLIISFGSCITYNYIEKGVFVGGAISPGIYQRFEVLNKKTANLPLLNVKKNSPMIGVNTEQSILSGVLHGAQHEVNGFTQFYHQNRMLNKVIFTGGDAIYFEGTLKNTTFVHQDIVLKGLKCILDFNQIS